MIDNLTTFLRRGKLHKPQMEKAVLNPAENKERDLFLGLTFAITFLSASRLLQKIIGLELIWSGILMALVVLCLAAMLDLKKPFPNKHAWKMISIAIIFPMLIFMGV